MHSYQHNIKTFNSSTRHLTRVERSLYRDLIELYYDTEKPLCADNFERLSRLVIANSQEEQDALQYVLREFFELVDGFYVHHYCDEQIAKFYANTTAKALAGKASAKARLERKEQRKRKIKEPDSTELNACSTDVERISTNQKPVTSNHISTNVDIGASQKKQPAVIPDWIPRDAWLGFAEMRKAKKAPMTDRAVQLIQKKLIKFMNQGYDIEQILNYSTMKCYTDVYEPKDHTGAMHYASNQRLTAKQEQSINAGRTLEAIYTESQSEIARIRASVQELGGGDHGDAQSSDAPYLSCSIPKL